MSRDLFPNSEESMVVRALGIIRRRAVVAAVACAAVLAAAGAFAYYLPDLYRAHAIVLVERPLGDTVLRSNVSNELENRLHVIRTTILSRDRLLELVRRFDLYPELRQRGSINDVLTRASEDIDWEPNGPEQVAGRTRTVTFTLSYTGDDRAKVADVTNAVAGFYVDYNDEMRAAEARSQTAFIKQQLDAAQKELDAAERTLRTFVAANERLLPQAASVNAATYTRLSDDLRRNRNEQARAREAIDRILIGLEEAQIAASTAPTPSAVELTELGVEPSKELRDLSDRLTKAQDTLIEMERRGWGDLHPEVRPQKALIAQLEQAVDAQRKRDIAAFEARKALAEEQAQEADAPRPDVPIRSRSIESYQADIKTLQQEEADIQAQLNAMITRFDNSPGVQQEYLLIQTDHRAAKEKYDVLLRRYEEAKANESLEAAGQGERFRVLEAAIPPEGPAAPNRLRLLLMGLLLALAAGAAAVVTVEQFDTSFHTVDDLREFTHVPVLASIPQIGSAPRRGYLRLALGTVSAVAVIVLVGTLSAYFANGNEMLVRLLQRAG